MQTVAWLRNALVTLLIAAQPASAAVAAGAWVLGAPCPVHAALLVPDSAPAGHHASGTHHGHGPSHEMPALADDGEPPRGPDIFNCCAGHLVGLCAAETRLGASGWTSVKAVAVQAAPATADLSKTDPPPRLL